MITDIISHGPDGSVPYQIGPAKPVITADGLDTLVLPYAAAKRDAFVRGAAAPVPWQAFVIADIDQEEAGDDWLLTLRCEGLQGPKQVKGYPQIDDKSQGWDTVVDEWITTNRKLFRRGQTGSYGGTTVCTNVTDSQLRAGVYKVRGTFTGVLANKPPSRSVTCNGQSFSGDFYVNLEGGWSNIRTSQIDLAKILVTDTYYTTTRPNTAAVPGTQTPPNAPNIRFLAFSGEVIAHWPNGWSYTTAYDQLPGVSLYKVDHIYEYKYKFTPGS